MEVKETYYSKNHDQCLEYQKQRYPKIKEEIKEYNHEYYMAHKKLLIIF